MAPESEDNFSVRALVLVVVAGVGSLVRVGVCALRCVAWSSSRVRVDRRTSRMPWPCNPKADADAGLERVFGTRLVKMQDEDVGEGGVPLVLKHCAKFLRENGLGTEGERCVYVCVCRCVCVCVGGGVGSLPVWRWGCVQGACAFYSYSVR